MKDERCSPRTYEITYDFYGELVSKMLSIREIKEEEK